MQQRDGHLDKSQIMHLYRMTIGQKKVHPESSLIKVNKMLSSESKEPSNIAS